MRSLMFCAAALLALLLPSVDARAQLVVSPRTVAPNGALRFALHPAGTVRKATFAIDGRTVDVDRRRPFACGARGVVSAASLGAGTHRLTVRVWRGAHSFTLARTVEVDGAGTPGDPPPPSAAPVWADEFNGPAGAPPDPARWNFDTGRWHDGGEDERYTDRPENVSLDGEGNLRIVARFEVTRDAFFTSARINTRGQFEPAYGRIEARIKVPAGDGLLPAFWLLGAGVDPWPQSGEIDAMEVPGNNPFGDYGHVHGPAAAAPTSDASEERVRWASTAYSDAFHVYGIEWRAGSIQFLVDGHAVGAPVTPATYSAAGGVWVFDRPFYLVLNLAVGNRWTGKPNASTRFPATMLIDWVRAYG